MVLFLFFLSDYNGSGKNNFRLPPTVQAFRVLPGNLVNDGILDHSRFYVLMKNK